MSDKVITADLMARLQRHYIKPGEVMPGGMFLPEVSLGGRRADALYVGFFSSRGRWLVGHEVKASRADWLRELDHPEKAEVWAPHCHSWWIVAPNSDVVRPVEMPDGWGLMVPGKSTTRMEIVVKAAHYPERAPSWEATHALVQRADSLRIAAVTETERKAAESVSDLVARRVEQIQQYDPATALQQRAERAEGVLRRIEAILGVTVVDREVFAAGQVSLEQLESSFAAWLMADAATRSSLQFQRGAVARVRAAAEEAEKALEALVRKQEGAS